MLSALAAAGIYDSPSIRAAVENGLKLIRIRKYEERQGKKKWKNRPHNR